MRRPAEHSLALKPRPAGTTLQQWLYGALCDAIRDGTLQPGGRLPTTRSLARDHGVSRSTVTAVFEQLLADGYICARVGRGSFVAPGRSPQPDGAADVPLPASPIEPFLSRRGRQMAHHGAHLLARHEQLPRTFDADRIDPSLFPSSIWARLAARRARCYEGRITERPHGQGLASLRQALADQLALTRGLRVDAGQIAIVSSTREAADLLVRLLVNPGEPVWLEDPGSHALATLLATAGAKVVPVPVDDEGLRVDAGVQAAPRARLACVTAAAQMPLGPPLSPGRRIALLGWAQSTGAYILDKDLDGDFHFAGPPPEALKATDAADCVIHLGSLAYSIAPSKRLAYVVLPSRLVDPFCQAMALTHGQPSLLEQAVLSDFIAEGHWARHIRHLRSVYGLRADALRHHLDRHFGHWLQLPSIQRGLSVTARLPDGIRDAEVAAQADAAGVSVTPLSAYRLAHATPAGLRLGFAAFSEVSIRSGVQLLARAIG